MDVKGCNGWCWPWRGDEGEEPRGAIYCGQDETLTGGMGYQW